jgi:hypothetical protein
MYRLRRVVAWQGYVISALSSAVSVVMVAREVAWPMGYVIGITSLCLFGMSHLALAPLRG